METAGAFRKHLNEIMEKKAIERFLLRLGMVEQTPIEDLTALKNRCYDDAQSVFGADAKLFLVPFLSATPRLNDSTEGKPGGKSEGPNFETRKLCVGLKTISKLFDKDTMFVRDCYPDMLICCLETAKKRCVCVTGDPGIGKSFFAFYVFLALLLSGEKVVLVHQSGSALCFNGSEEVRFEKEYHGYDWTDEHTWLLLDGHAPDRYLSKSRRGIVFASPQKSNYHELLSKTVPFCTCRLGCGTKLRHSLEIVQWKLISRACSPAGRNGTINY
jgi:hypothetical protein